MMEDNIFYEISKNFDNDFAIIEARMIEADVLFLETAEARYITEKDNKSLGDSLKKFFYTLIERLRRLASDISIKISSTVRSAQYQSKMKKLRNELKKENRDKIITVPNIWKLKNTYMKDVRILEKYSNKFAKNRYNNTDEVDRDLRIFTELYKNFDEDLTKISKEKVNIQVSTMLDFLDKELSGKNDVVSTLNVCIDSMKKMEAEAARFSEKEDIFGAKMLDNKNHSKLSNLKDDAKSDLNNFKNDIAEGTGNGIKWILSKILGLFHKVTSIFTGFVKKWVVGIMTVCLLIF